MSTDKVPFIRPLRKSRVVGKIVQDPAKTGVFAQKVGGIRTFWDGSRPKLIIFGPQVGGFGLFQRPVIGASFDYDVRLTIPHYDRFHEETLDLVRTAIRAPAVWLDTGCGTGSFVCKAATSFPSTRFVLADPSVDMLSIARTNCPADRVEHLCVGSQDLACADASFDVITAIQSHHYFHAGERRKATDNCFRMLKAGGIFVTFENIRPSSDRGIDIGLKRWERFQISNGRSPIEVEAHIKRFDCSYFPIPIVSHVDLLTNAGFSVVEVLWASAMQAGFYAVKG